MAIGRLTVAYATLDHKLALACGGQDTNENTTLACADCNERKGSRYGYDEFMALKQAARKARGR